LVDVRDVAVSDLEVVDLERIDRLQRLLPAALLHRYAIGDLLASLRQIDMNRRLVDLDYGDAASERARAPVDAAAQTLDPQDRRLRMLVLRDCHIAQIEREPERME